MLQRNPKSPNELPPTADVLRNRESEVQQATDERFQKYLKKRRRMIAIGKVAVTTGLFIGANVSPYLADVRANMLETADARPSVVERQPDHPIDEHKANVFMHGFNTYGAQDLINRLGDGYQDAFDGESWAVQYNNAPLSSNLIGTMLVDRFEEQDISSTDFVLYSQGGVTGAEAVTKVIADTWVDVENVTFASSPSSYDTLTDKTKEEIGIAKDMAWIPWIEYSTLFRLGAEAYFYRNEMQSNFAAASNGIMTRYGNGDMTSNQFIGSQINKMVEANVASEIEKWGEYADTKHMPNINYILIEDDKVVDNREAAKEICTAAQKIGAHCTILTVKADHGGYFQPSAIEDYNRVFNELSDIVAPYTSQEASRHALTLYGIYQDERLLLEPK